MTATRPQAADPGGPRLTVVVPARNCPDHVRFCLGRLERSRCREFELLVVDDASDDDTAAVAEGLGARVVRLERWSGPAAARNRGAEEARAPLVFFVDADVGVYPDTLDHVLEAFDRDPELDALFGSYDTAPLAPNFLSQYRNLLHHFVHQQGNEEACTFWSGCGAIRRAVFLEHGGFDPALYGRPAIEDIELGARLVAAGRRIRVVKHLQVTHLKRWTLWGIVRTDVWDRGIPWTRLILREGSMPDDLNTSAAQRLALVLTWVALAVLLVAAWFHPALLLLPVGLGLVVLIVDRASERGKVPVAAGCALAVATAAGLIALGLRAPVPLLVLAALVGAVVFLNGRLYRFYTRERGVGFAALVVPLHLLYYLYSGVAFGLGLAGHLLAGRPAARAG